MGRSLSRADYARLARHKGLQHLGNPPSSVYEQTRWKCLRCGHTSEKTYRAVDQGPGCNCRSTRNKQPEDYHQFAAEQGIEWVYTPGTDKFPHNTKTPTTWRNPDTGKTVEASYNEIYQNPRKTLRDALGLD